MLRWWGILAFLLLLSLRAMADTWVKVWYFGDDSVAHVGLYSSQSARDNDSRQFYRTNENGQVSWAYSNNYIILGWEEQVPGFVAAVASVSKRSYILSTTGTPPSIIGIKGFSGSGSINTDGGGDISGGSLNNGGSSSIGGSGSTPGSGSSNTNTDTGVATLTGNWLTGQDYFDGLAALNSAEETRKNILIGNLDLMYQQQQLANNRLELIYIEEQEQSGYLDLINQAISLGFTNLQDYFAANPWAQDFYPALKEDLLLLGGNIEDVKTAIESLDFSDGGSSAVVTVDMSTTEGLLSEISGKLDNLSPSSPETPTETPSVDLTETNALLSSVDDRLAESVAIQRETLYGESAALEALQDESEYAEEISLSEDEDSLLSSFSAVLGGSSGRVASAVSAFDGVLSKVVGTLPKVGSDAAMFSVNFELPYFTFSRDFSFADYPSLKYFRAVVCLSLYIFAVFVIVRILKSTLEQ